MKDIFQPPHRNDVLEILDHVALYLVCCTMIGVVLYLAIGQVH